MIDQLVPMIGVLLGSFATYLGSSVVERAQFKRLLATRWDEGKLETYAEYASAVKDMLRAAGRYMEARDDGRELAGLRAELEAADDVRSRIFERVVLLGDPDVTEAGKEVNRQVLETRRLALDPATPAGQNLGGDDVVGALNGLHEAARKDLGITRSPRRRYPMLPGR
ncbi:hypothetical protein AB0L82_22170 [Nocardia sp. NPDC052001]|uniref:hypothetical protein n=1 Tax=Nocardia sp. NPDC052001 TaxID=3154853 RepID=UPI003430E123